MRITNAIHGTTPIVNATSEFKIHRAITRFSAGGIATLTLLSENGSTALTIEGSQSEISLVEHELANILIILKMRSRLTDREMQEYKRVVNEEGIKLVGESRERDY